MPKNSNNKSFDDYNMSWFVPTDTQKAIINAVEHESLFTIIDAPSGCGKTSIALYIALNSLKRNDVRSIYFIKTPAETGDDKIGFLSGDQNEKLEAHFETTKAIFSDFMSLNKLSCDIKNGKINLKTPNFLLGATISNSIVILDESQLFSRNTMKLLLERMGPQTKYIVLGDSKQTYARDYRSDGFADFIEKVTTPSDDGRTSIDKKFVSYFKLPRTENKRSAGSMFINSIYE